jgi:purine-nucleoside phosphorylase
MSEYLWSAFDITSFLFLKTSCRPEVGIVCGFGNTGLMETLGSREVFNYVDIPGFPNANAAGYSGELVFGVLNGLKCVFVHQFTDSVTTEQIIVPIQVLRLMGVKVLLTTSTAESRGAEFNVGGIMIVRGSLIVRFTDDEQRVTWNVKVGGTTYTNKKEDPLGPRLPSTKEGKQDDVLPKMVVAAAAALNLRSRIHKNGRLGSVTSSESSRARFLEAMSCDCVDNSITAICCAAKHCGMNVMSLVVATSQASLPEVAPAVVTALETAERDIEAIMRHILDPAMLHLNSLPAPFVLDPAQHKKDKATAAAAAEQAALEHQRILMETGRSVVTVMALAGFVVTLFYFLRRRQ